MANPRFWPQRKVIRPAAPAAGVEVSISPNAGGLWIVHSLVLTLTTAATVADRTVRLLVDDGTTVWLRTTARSVVAASSTVVVAAFEGLTGDTTVGDTVPVSWPTGGVVLLPGYRLRTDTVNLQAGDAFSTAALMVDDWPLGPSSRFRPVPSFVIEES